MKQGWQIKRLGEICEIYAGQGAPQGEDNYCTQGTPFIKAGNLEALTSGESESNIQQVSEDVAKSHKLVKYKKGSVVFAKSGMSCMKGYIYTLQGDCYVVSHLAILTPKQIESSFLNYCLQVYKPCSLAKEAAFPSITLKELSSFEIPVPSFSEQQRIVALLDAEFAKIDALKANAEKNLQNAKDLFQAALKKELEPKEGWFVSTLQQMLKLTSGDNLTAKSIVAGVYPVYGGNGIMGYHNQYNLDGENVIVGRVGALCGNVRFVKGKIWYTDNAFLVNDKTKSFYLPFLTYELTKANLRQYATQAAQPVISNVSMKDVVLSIPPTINDQQTIVARLDVLSEKCKNLQANYEKTLNLCDDLKQALLRKAFNGEI